MIKLEFIWIAFSFYLCLFKIYFIFQCLSRPWVHLGTLPSLPVPGTALILLTAQDPTQGPGTVRPCPREVLGFCLCLSWLIPQPTPFPQRFLMSRAGAVCSTPCHALPWLSWHPGPWKHHPSQHHNNIYSLFLNNYNTFFFLHFLLPNWEEIFWFSFLLWSKICVSEQESISLNYFDMTGPLHLSPIQ